MTWAFAKLCLCVCLWRLAGRCASERRHSLSAAAKLRGRSSGAVGRPLSGCELQGLSLRAYALEHQPLGRCLRVTAAQLQGLSLRASKLQPGVSTLLAEHSTATVWYESTAPPRLGDASIRILMPGGAGTGGVVSRLSGSSMALADGRSMLCGVQAVAAANICRPGREGVDGHVDRASADICSPLLIGAQTRRTKACRRGRASAITAPGQLVNQPE